MDSTLITIIIRSLLTIIVAVLSWVIGQYVVPWLKQNNLYSAAKVAVQAVEAIYGRYNGDEKLKAALAQLQNKGFNIDSDEVMNAIKAAWLELNLAQIASGEKETSPAELDIQ